MTRITTAPHSAASAAAHLEAARSACAAGRWQEAQDAARRAVAAEESAEALELLGLASWWLSDAETMFQARERAFRLYVDRGEHRRAARLATWLDWDYRGFRGESVVANGWLRRARRLLDGDQACAEYGWLVLREADARLFEDAVAAARGAAEAAALGRRFGDRDLEHLALAFEGRALVTAGAVTEGMQKLDEATAAVVADEFLDRGAAGVTCCHLIAACEVVRDFDRAGQWCARVREYCRRWDHPALFTFCRTLYASVLVSRGEWAAAEAELATAVDGLVVHRPGWVAMGEVGLGELRRRQGRLEEAEGIFERIAPVPQAGRSFTAAQARLGLAAIALERGDPAGAEQLARGVLRQIGKNNHAARAAALELIILAASAGARVRHVADEMRELRELAAAVDSEGIRASAHFAAAAIAAGQGEVEAARDTLAEAAAGFDRAGAPYDALRARLFLAEQLQTTGELKAAASEAGTVARGAKQLGARSLERRAATLGRTTASRGGASSRLTRREGEVLGQVAQGLTNRQIATRLGVSEHTVHRHLANIFTRLGLSSRAAAVAYAVRQGMG